MKVRAYVDDQRVGALFERSSQRLERAGRDAIRWSANEVAQEILRVGRLDIRGAGKFGPRWTEGLEAGVSVTEGGGNDRVAVTHSVPYWRGFAYVAVIH